MGVYVQHRSSHNGANREEKARFIRCSQHFFAQTYQELASSRRNIFVIRRSRSFHQPSREIMRANTPLWRSRAPHRQSAPRQLFLVQTRPGRVARPFPVSVLVSVPNRLGAPFSRGVREGGLRGCGSFRFRLVLSALANIARERGTLCLGDSCNNRNGKRLGHPSQARP